MKTNLLTRDDFRNAVFSRDGHRCVFCQKPAKDAHHIIERRLWKDGGYHLNNGASVCEEHHILCEQTKISVEQIREACKISKPIIPEHLYSDERYDKWGNIILENGQRLKGELFFDESVQKVLKDSLDLFTDKVKYPRTHHLPWSENMNEDDRLMDSTQLFVGKRVIVTEKMDGENTSFYKDYVHARSINSKNHPTRDWVKNFWSSIAGEIPDGWRICGENLWGKHSIYYINLPSFFMGFSIWNERNECLSWDETQEWFKLLNIVSVPVLYDGIWDESKIKGLYRDNQWEFHEGYVIRIADKFSYSEFRKVVGKFVRKNHIQTTKHWMHGQAIERNHMEEKCIRMIP